ncbi:hypothetical protein MUK71_07115 [Arthrobacter zhangbolii]|uniref:Uncharacterized protein n=1 Tax=Arthrobacter zhangbolii TaxID=2886936 RepID=A0A9X1M5K8_9MICC|nr:hypothetical protein [Arthrobacter zhangbolii]MCC3271809.1 hypothetical protein [Arthrobacter zhangbolii]MCC3293713.1 hypothetical protein [Arthrobacter zhangbolii]UON93366.1 hypothetical protein MUK71_07115 [Arthrobacter zhangbolii]
MSQEPAWSQKRAKRMVALLLSACVSFWLVILLPFDEPWNWLMAGLSLALAGAFVTLLARLALRQRDDYWRGQRNTDR